MADLLDFSAEDRGKLEEWIEARPPAVRKVARRLPPWRLYRLKSSGHRVTIYSYGETRDGSVLLQVDVTGKYNFVAFERRVFDVEPDDLEECDLPDPDELLGTAVSGPVEMLEVVVSEDGGKAN